MVATLRTNTYFTSIVMHEKTRKEAIAGLAGILTKKQAPKTRRKRKSVAVMRSFLSSLGWVPDIE